MARIDSIDGFQYYYLHERICYGCHLAAIDAKTIAQATGSVSGTNIVIRDGYIDHAARAERKIHYA